MQQPVTQLSASDPVHAHAAGSAAAFLGGHWLADDVHDTPLQLSDAPTTTDMTHVHAITARAAVDAAATALLNPMYAHACVTTSTKTASATPATATRNCSRGSMRTTPSVGTCVCTSLLTSCTATRSLPRMPSLTVANAHHRRPPHAHCTPTRSWHARLLPRRLRRAARRLQHRRHHRLRWHSRASDRASGLGPTEYAAARVFMFFSQSNLPDSFANFVNFVDFVLFGKCLNPLREMGGC